MSRIVFFTESAHFPKLLIWRDRLYLHKLYLITYIAHISSVLPCLHSVAPSTRASDPSTVFTVSLKISKWRTSKCNTNFWASFRTLKIHRNYLIENHNLVLLPALHTIVKKKSSKFQEKIRRTFRDITFFVQRSKRNSQTQVSVVARALAMQINQYHQFWKLNLIILFTEFLEN